MKRNCQYFVTLSFPPPLFFLNWLCRIDRAIGLSFSDRNDEVITPLRWLQALFLPPADTTAVVALEARSQLSLVSRSGTVCNG